MKPANNIRPIMPNCPRHDKYVLSVPISVPIPKVPIPLPSIESSEVSDLIIESVCPFVEPSKSSDPILFLKAIRITTKATTDPKIIKLRYRLQ